MQNHIKTKTRLAFIQFIFSSFFSDLSIEEDSNDFEKYFNKLTVSSIKKLNEIFRKSFIIELYWENKIDYEVKKLSNENNYKISILNLLKKYFSKRLRMFLK